ncbi:hypothetical protein NQZ68_007163 [Dissostichus eleginoides]|nr:hypothetical protein NQZ68_007163 [Dissostichus eleginoides]
MQRGVCGWRSEGVAGKEGRLGGGGGGGAERTSVRQQRLGNQVSWRQQSEGGERRQSQISLQTLPVFKTLSSANSPWTVWISVYGASVTYTHPYIYPAIQGPTTQYLRTSLGQLSPEEDPPLDSQ